MVRRFWVFALLVPCAVYLSTVNGLYSSDYPSSILGMQFAMWSNHSFSLGSKDHLVVISVDLASYNGLFYSAISPGFAIFSYPFAALGFAIDGSRTLNVWGHGMLFDEFFLATTSSVAVLFTYKIGRFYASPVSSLLASLTLAFASPLWPTTTFIFIQGASVMFVAVSVYLLIRYVKSQNEERSLSILVGSGVFLGLAGFIEYPAFLLIGPIVGYLVSTIKPRRVPVARILLGFSIGPALQLAYDAFVFGSPLRFPEALKVGANSPLLARFDVAGTLFHAAMYLVSPYRGILLFSPVLGLGLYQLCRTVMTRNSERRDGALFLSFFVIVTVFYSSWGDWAGGLAYGPRFLTLALPFLALPVASLLDGMRRGPPGAWMTFGVLFALSVIIEGTGALTTALSEAGGPLFYQPIAANSGLLMQGKLDSWWTVGYGAISVTTRQVFASFLLGSLGLLPGLFASLGPAWMHTPPNRLRYHRVRLSPSIAGTMDPPSSRSQRLGGGGSKRLPVARETTSEDPKRP